MNINKTPETIWPEYENGVSYKETIRLYDTVKKNQNFYNGKQWEGVNAPDIEKPVVNICKQWVDYAVSMLVSDDIGVRVKLPDDLTDDTKKALEYVINGAILDVIEVTKFRSKTRKFLKNCAIDGDALYHWWFDTTKRTAGKYKGQVNLEILKSTNVIFGDPSTPVVEDQPYIIVISKLPTDSVKDMAKGNDSDEVVDDTKEYNQRESDAKSVAKYTTVLTKFWKEDGIVYFMKSTQKVILTPATSTRTRIFPIVHMGWKEEDSSYHGISPLTEIIPNQIMINKFYMMQNEFNKKMSFPKILYDMNKIDHWSNKVEALGVNGDPRDAVAVSTPTMNANPQLAQGNKDLLEMTKSTLGVYDVSLGNVRPENTSAIIALQKTAAQPLEMQKLDYYQVVEDSVHIIMDIMAANYGVRPTSYETDTIEKGSLKFDFADLINTDIIVSVDVGSAAYWAEITQIQTLDNMYKAQIIPDPITYLEQLPAGILPNKNAIIDANRKAQQAQQMALMAQQGIAPQSGQPSPSQMPTNISQPQMAGGSISGILAKNKSKVVV